MLNEALRLEDGIRDHLAPVLRRDGFTGSGRNYRALVGDMVCIVNVQASSFGNRFYVNLAAQPLCVPDLEGALVEPKKVVHNRCEFRRRLSEDGVDHAWDYTDQRSMDLAVADAAAMYERVGRAFFDQLTSPEGTLHEISADKRVAPEYAASLFTSEARLYRALAFMSMARNDADQASRFAALALELSGESWSAQSGLSDLIKRAELTRKA